MTGVIERSVLRILGHLFYQCYLVCLFYLSYVLTSFFEWDVAVGRLA